MSNALIIMGIALIIAGIAFKYGLLDWFGNLPGDIKYQGEHSFFFFPITSMIVVSSVLSALMWLFRR
jgi:hypothetical protein